MEEKKKYSINIPIDNYKEKLPNLLIEQIDDWIEKYNNMDETEKNNTLNITFFMFVDKNTISVIPAIQNRPSE